ncbi:hypothetical protein LJC56_04545 [Christensenellaceae bacterium OttesenSCG-928-K19]|nr:hypothetical protein [Christensenellaceae bacterium OttesenSCG-928-K19]
MPYCPNCKDEYREGYTICVECGVQLVDILPDKWEERQQQLKTKGSAARRIFLTIAVDEEQCTGMVSALQKNGVTVYIDGMEAGDYLNTHGAFSSYGGDLYVDRDDYEKGLAVLTQYAQSE